MRRTLVLLLAVGLTAGMLIPTAAANWKFRGQNEPDTFMDVQDGLMFLDPDTDPSKNTRKVYFNGFAVTPGVGYVSMNVAETGSRVNPTPYMTFTALMGIWKDCNDDGYVGNAASALIEYRSELLTSSSICPPEAPPAGPYKKEDGIIWPHNDGNWVREFLFIGPKWMSINPTTIYAEGAMVWHDWNLPGEEPPTTCPGGNTGVRSVGKFLDWQDCANGYRIMTTLNDVESASGLPVGGWNTNDPDNSTGPLNVRNPAFYALYGPKGDGEGGYFGQDRDYKNERRDRFYSAWDCSQATTPSGSTSVDPDGSLYETANETYNIATTGYCKPEEHTSIDGEHSLQYPALESDSNSQTASKGRDKVDTAFTFNTGNRNLLLVGGPGSVLGPYPPHDLGVGADRDLDTVGPSWRTNTLWGQNPQLISRATLAPTPASYMTFYASIGSNAYGFQLPVNAGGQKYGAAACGTATTGVVKGWNCDKDAWDLECARDDRQALQCPKIRDTYDVRDIDCWDGTLVRGVPARASLVDLHPDGPCLTHSAYEQPVS